MDLQTASDTEQQLRAALPASGLMARAAHPTLNGVIAMAEPATSAGAGVLLAKLLPAGAGAILMVLVEPPQNKRELFARLFAGFAMSLILTSTTIDALHSVPWFAFFDRHNIEHICAVAGLWGAIGWFVVGGLGVFAKRFRADPTAAVKELKP